MEPQEREVKTASGIYLPDTGEKRQGQGVVIAVGPGKVEKGERQPVEVKIGDVVVFKQYSPDEVKLENKTFLIVSVDDITAVIE